MTKPDFTLELLLCRETLTNLLHRLREVQNAPKVLADLNFNLEIETIEEVLYFTDPRRSRPG